MGYRVMGSGERNGGYSVGGFETRGWDVGLRVSE
jgi:hypothetical protein